MDAMIRTADKRRGPGFDIINLSKITYEAIEEYLISHKKAFNVWLFHSQKHENFRDKGGAFFTREEYFEFMRSEACKNNNTSGGGLNT